MQMPTFYIIYCPKVGKWIGKRDPTYAVYNTATQHDAYWWAATAERAKSWTSLTAIRRFRGACPQQPSRSDFEVHGSDGTIVNFTTI